MEHVLFLILLIVSHVGPGHLPEPMRPVVPERRNAAEPVWAIAYPTLAKAAGRRSASVLGDPESEISPVALYATNRVVWNNFFEAADAGADGDVDDARLLIAERLWAFAAAVLSPDAPPDALSPAVRELVTAYMDLADLAVPVRPPDSGRISSPALAAFFRLYREEADDQDWRAFADAAQQLPFREALHLLPRVPRHFLGHALGLVEQIGPPADFAEAELRVQARSLMMVRLKMAGQ